MSQQLHRVFDLDGNEVDSFTVEVPDPPQPDPEPVAADTVIASVAAMSDEQKQQLREALGL